MDLTISSGCVYLPVGSGALLIDLSDAHRVLTMALSLNNRGYAHVKRPWKPVHRLLLDAPPGMDVDHINGDRLDNRRENLRLVTHRENCQNRRKLNRNNTSGATGVYWRKRVHCWQVYISIGGKAKSLGYFKNKDVAIAKRQEAERLYYCR